MSQDVPHINLDELITRVAVITVQGKKHDVLPIHGEARVMLEAITAAAKAGGANDDAAGMIDRAKQIVRCVVPTLTAAQIDRLSYEQLTAIAQIAIGAEEKVRAVIAAAVGKGGGLTKPRTRSGRR